MMNYQMRLFRILSWPMKSCCRVRTKVPTLEFFIEFTEERSAITSFSTVTTKKNSSRQNNCFFVSRSLFLYGIDLKREVKKYYFCKCTLDLSRNGDVCMEFICLYVSIGLLCFEISHLVV